MWLIDTSTLGLQEFPDERNIEYAILSHRWEEEEVLFRHMSPGHNRRSVKKMKGFRKIRECCERALQQGLRYAWVDTCCIDKSSSAELQEAINSMFRWYSSAQICYAYLSDVVSPDHKDAQLRASQWFKRGWTLQELLAPKELVFVDRDWMPIGTRYTLHDTISEITRIKNLVLAKQGFTPDLLENEVRIAEVMSWAKDRQTTRIEDRAYSLMGMFGVNMTMLYGEGENAFKRLQEEILRHTNDQSIFFNQRWSGPCGLAGSPDDFDCWERVPRDPYFNHSPLRSAITITNEGIALTVELVRWTPGLYLALLNTGTTIMINDQNRAVSLSLGIFLRYQGENRYFRSPTEEYGLWIGSGTEFHKERTIVILVNRVSHNEWLQAAWHSQSCCEFEVTMVRETGLVDRGRLRKQSFALNAATWEATWDNRETHLILEPGAGGFVGAVAIGKSSPPAHNAMVVMLGVFGNFVPYCAVRAMRWTEIEADAMEFWNLNTEASIDYGWKHVADLELPANSGVDVKQNERSSADCKMLLDKTLLVRPVKHGGGYYYLHSNHPIDISCSFASGDGYVNICDIKLRKVEYVDELTFTLDITCKAEG